MDTSEVQQHVGLFHPLPLSVHIFLPRFLCVHIRYKNLLVIDVFEPFTVCPFCPFCSCLCGWIFKAKVSHGTIIEYAHNYF
jgi:hypothetical protein